MMIFKKTLLFGKLQDDQMTKWPNPIPTPWNLGQDTMGPRNREGVLGRSCGLAWLFKLVDFFILLLRTSRETIHQKSNFWKVVKKGEIRKASSAFFWYERYGGEVGELEL